MTVSVLCVCVRVSVLVYFYHDVDIISGMSWQVELHIIIQSSCTSNSHSCFVVVVVHSLCFLIRQPDQNCDLCISHSQSLSCINQLLCLFLLSHLPSPLLHEPNQTIVTVNCQQVNYNSKSFNIVFFSLTLIFSRMIPNTSE
jgi:hypothetical protein